MNKDEIRKNIEFESFTIEDFLKTNKWINDPEIMSRSFIRQKVSVSEQEKIFRRLSSDKSYIFHKLIFQGRFIGAIGVKKIDYINRNGEIWIYIGEKEFWGQGIGTIAIRKYSELITKNYNLHKIYATVLSDNIPSLKMFMKAGFNVEGKLLDHVFFNGEFKNIIILARIFKQD